MFHSRRNYNKVNRLHELLLRIIYKNNISSDVDLLAKDKSFTIHQRNIHSLGIELLKVERNLANLTMCNIFKTRTLTYNLRSKADFVRDCVKTRLHGPNSLSYFAPKVGGYDSFRNKQYKFSSKKLKLRLENGLRKTALVIFVCHTYRI